MNQLDLHGIKHADVQLLVEDWVLVHQTEVPLRIICGNSAKMIQLVDEVLTCLLYTSPSPRDQRGSRMPSSA